MGQGGGRGHRRRPGPTQRHRDTDIADRELEDVVGLTKPVQVVRDEADVDDPVEDRHRRGDGAGIRVFATGGLGGVHRGAAQTFDVSADLGVLSRTPVLTVCAGVKSILDVAGTLEYLETLSVPVLGYRTDAFPGFYLTDSGYPVPWRVDTPQEAAAVLLARDRLGADSAGIVLANPLPQDRQVDPVLHDRLVAEGLQALADEGVTGKDVTPRLLELFHERSGGESLRANVELVLANARLAGEVAVAAADVAAGRG